MELTVGALYYRAFGKEHKTLSTLRFFDDTGESIRMYPSPKGETPPQKILHPPRCGRVAAGDVLVHLLEQLLCCFALRQVSRIGRRLSFYSNPN
ncbi:hypothetical protein QUB56_12075 [Microcoleus sp. AR_TQ3_B6]|uniref:hypothetical protein n=1 Tax=Microcoleus sp. AR_TQ3_B6 TaxID=3055284 RepID=UPI002FD526F1